MNTSAPANELCDCPNTAKFWRLNTITALTETLIFEPDPYSDPEAMEYYRQCRLELELLKEQESKVLDRYERIKAMRAKHA